MDRRSFLLNASAYALPIPSGDEMHFKIFRNGSPVGEHVVSFSPSGADLTVTTNARFVVTVAMIPVFHYTAKAIERWSNGVFQGVDSAVNYNGTQLEVHAERTADGYNVRGTHMPPYTAPPNTLPLTYWNKAMINGTILNIQTAHSDAITVRSPGWFNLPTATGGSVTAQRFDVSGKLSMTVWYDSGNKWSGLEFQKRGDFVFQKYV